VKFIAGYNAINKFQNLDCELLEPIVWQMSPHRLITHQWGNHWVISADDYFHTYCKLTFNTSLVVIHDNEFTELKTNRILFLSKSRVTELWRFFWPGIDK